MLEAENHERSSEDIQPRIKTSKDLHIAKRIALAVTGIIGLTVISILVQLFISAVNPGFKEIEDSTKNGILNFIIYSVLFVALVSIVNVDFRLFKPDFKNYKAYLFGLAFGAGVIITPIIYNIFVNLFRETTTSANEASLRSFIPTFPSASLFILGIIGPLCEELTYRVGLFNIVKKYKWVGYLLGTFVFAFMHFNFNATGEAMVNELINLPIYAFSGFAFCLAYDKFGFACSFTAHSINNLYSVAMVLLLNNMQIQ